MSNVAEIFEYFLLQIYPLLRSKRISKIGQHLANTNAAFLMEHSLLLCSYFLPFVTVIKDMLVINSLFLLILVF